MFRIRRPIKALAVALVAAAASLLAPAARAQWGGADDFAQFDAFSVPLTRAGFDNYARLLALDDEQKELGRALLDGFVEGHKGAVKEMQQVMRDASEKARETGDFMAFGRDVQEKMKGIQQRIETLEKSFFADLKALLTPQQAEQWPRVERMRRREQGLRFGMVSGAGVDVIRVVDALHADTSAPELRGVLERYELEVDRALQEMEALARGMQDLGGDGGMPDMARMGEAMNKLRDSARTIRDINRAAARQVEPLLPEDKRAEFAREFKRRSFPSVYRETHAVRCLKAVAGFDDLTSDQRARLDEVRAAFERDAGPLDDRWAAAIEDRDNKEHGSFMEMAMEMAADMGQGFGDPDSPVAQARKARRELDQATVDRIKSVLSEDQKKRLPEPPSEPRGMEAIFGAEALGGG